MDDVQIVEIDPELDVPACADVFIAAFAAEPWNEHWPVATVQQRLAEILASPGSLGLAAVEDDGCVGFVAGYVESFHPTDRFQLAEMAVRPSHQRRGLGSALIRGLLGRLAVRNVDEVFLVTARGESPEAFWRSQSFVTSPGRSVMVHRRARREW